MIVLSDASMQKKANRLRALFASAYLDYQGKAFKQFVNMEEVNQISEDIIQHLASYPEALSTHVNFFKAIIQQTRHSLQQLIEFNSDRQMEKDLRKEMLSQNIIKTKYFGFLTLFYLKDNAYYQQLLFIEERSKGHVLPESFYRYALACCDELMLLIERYYFSWLVVVSGAHGQLRQMRKWLLKLYFSLKAQYEKTSCNVWQLHDERQPIKSMNFVETMILNPDQATKGVCFQLWQGDNSVSGVDWWASQIFKLPQTQIADVKEFIRQQGDDLAAAVVKKIEKQLSQTITQEGLSRFYSSKWSLWVNDLHQRYQQWGYLQDSMWQNKLSQLSFLSRYAESAYQWASSHQTEGIAGEYRQAMVDLGFRMKSGGLDAN